MFHSNIYRQVPVKCSVLSLNSSMPYLNPKDIDTITVDFTSYCNAMCGNCSRNIGGTEVNPQMPLEHMKPNTWKKLFTEEICENINKIVLNGAYGDPLRNPYIFECLNYLRNYKMPEIHIHTNGGMNGPQFFAELAECLKPFPFPTHVVFSIDGLEDTNHLYRRNVQWHKVMENAKAFIDAGGLARWRMLVFKHNAHQLEEAEQLSKDMGFGAFDINGGYTFSAIDSVVNTAMEQFKASKKDTARTITYEKKHLDNVKRVEGLLEKGFDKGCITCKWQKKGKVQISHMGEVFPCCYTLADRYPKDLNSPYGKDINTIKWLNVNDMPLTDILESNTLTDPMNKRFKICEVTCGEV